MSSVFSFISELHFVRIPDLCNAVVPSFHPARALLALSIACLVSVLPIHRIFAMMSLPSLSCLVDAPGSTTSNVFNVSTLEVMVDDALLILLSSPKRVGSFNREVIADVAVTVVEKAAT